MGASKFSGKMSSFPPTIRGITRVLKIAGLSSLVVACGPESGDLSSETLLEDSMSGAASGGGGLSSNGLSPNGFSSNGLSANGLSANGLSANGLFTGTAWPVEFKTWCGLHIKDGLCNNVMTYVTKCACDVGISKGIKGTATDGGGAYSYSWPGLLGVGDGFCGGSAPTQEEKYRMTACLMAHSNSKAGQVSVSISIGLKGSSSRNSIVQTQDERFDHETIEGLYFGDLWANRRYVSTIFYYENPRWMAMGRTCTYSRSGTDEATDCGFVPQRWETTGGVFANCSTDKAGAFISCTPEGSTTAYSVAVVGLGAEAGLNIFDESLAPVFKFADGATYVWNKNAAYNDQVVSIPFDTTLPLAQVSWTRDVYPGKKYKVQVLYVNPSGTNRCHLRIVSGVNTIDQNFSLPAGSGLLVHDSVATFTAGDYTATFQLYTDTTQTLACPLIDSVILSRI